MEIARYADESRAETPQALRHEALWPILIAVLAAIALTLLRPSEVRVAPVWVLPTIEVVLLGVFILSPPERTVRRSGPFRVLAICIVGGLAVDALLATVLLISVLIQGGETTNSAEKLLLATCSPEQQTLVLWRVFETAAAEYSARPPGRAANGQHPHRCRSTVVGNSHDDDGRLRRLLSRVHLTRPELVEGPSTGSGRTVRGRVAGALSP
jgi:hypothetical protein